jgi:hypothetical protein
MRVIATLTALAASLLLVTAVPALADNNNNNNNNNSNSHNNSGNQDRLVRSAERACRQTAQNRGYDVRDVTGSRATSDRTARVDLRLRRKGDSYDGRCTYDRRDDRASLDVDRSNGNGGNGNSGKGNNGNGNLDKRAKEACWQRAYERNQKLNAFGKLQPDGRDYKVQVGTWRDGTTYQYWCFFDPSTNTADLRPRN